MHSCIPDAIDSQDRDLRLGGARARRPHRRRRRVVGDTTGRWRSSPRTASPHRGGRRGAPDRVGPRRSAARWGCERRSVSGEWDVDGGSAPRPPSAHRGTTTCSTGCRPEASSEGWGDARRPRPDERRSCGRRGERAGAGQGSIRLTSTCRHMALTPSAISSARSPAVRRLDRLGALAMSSWRTRCTSTTTTAWCAPKRPSPRAPGHTCGWRSCVTRGGTPSWPGAERLALGCDAENAGDAVDILRAAALFVGLGKANTSPSIRSASRPTTA